MNTQAVALHCPGCGAPAPPDASRCEYCRARLATVGCPVCFKLLFDGAAFCPYCGAARARRESVDGEVVRCPACTAEMQWMHVGGVDLLECGRCDGTWIESAGFERLCADREGQAAVLQKAPGQPARAAPTDRVRYRPCPRCRKLMNRMNFGRISGAIVDVCRGHGVFLDRGELHQVVRFILEGGLDRARQADREQLQEEQRRLRDAERRQAHVAPFDTQPAASSWNEQWFHQLLTAIVKRD
jgi:Zn-finger nucleic acid-binding protein